MTCEGKNPGPDEATPAEVEFMRHALRLARVARERGDTPVGSVVVYDGHIIGEGIEAVRADKDLTAHAEVRAVQEASMSLNTLDLAGCTWAISASHSSVYWNNALHSSSRTPVTTIGGCDQPGMFGAVRMG